MSMPRLYLLDAYALIFRAYFAFARNPRVNSKGVDTSAVYGFMLALLDVLEKEKPSHIAVVFDIGGSQVREELFPAYKANRDETPEGIKVAVPYIHQLLEAMKIPALGVPGFEADDVIGTLAHKAESAGYEVYMMTPDKDFGQLVTEKVKILKPGRGGDPAEVLGVQEVCDRWGIQRVDQVIDMLGLMGDAVDNIPGIPSVGEKTAAKLLAEYDTMEGILAHAEEIKGKLGEKIREFADQGRLSKVLARILTDVPIDLDERDLLREDPDTDKLKTLLDELEFRSLLRRLLPSPPAAPNASASAAPGASGTPSSAAAPSTDGQMDLFGTALPALESLPGSDAMSTDHTYTLLDNVVAVQFFARKLAEQPAFCFDTETTSLDTLEAELVGIAFSYEAHTAYFVALPADRSEAMALLEPLRGPLENPSIEKVGHNLKYDYQVLLNYGIRVQGPLVDTMLMHYLVEPDQRHGMDDLAQKLLGYTPIPITSLIGPKGKNQKTMRDADPAAVAEYAGEDADITWRLRNTLQPLVEDTGVQSIYQTMEAPLISVLSDMEMAGVKVDSAGLAAFSEELGQDLTRLEAEVFELAGQTFNLGSPKQLGDVLFDGLQIGRGKVKKTKTGQYATGEEVLEGYVKEHPIVEKLLEWRQVGKLKSTYVDALPKLIHPKTGRIHTTFNQAVAATGRLSSTNPNLQNIPIRTERGRRVRNLFVARDSDHILLSADYSQIELRVIASMSQDPAMLEAFRSGEDIHAATAAKVFGVPLSEVSREQRSHAKTVNFGIIYGVSAFGLSNQTTLSRSEAKEVIDSYFATYPGIKKYIDDQVASARSKGYVETLLGRRRYLRDIDSRNQAVRGHSERNAINAPIQGTAADIVKLAMIKVHARMQKEGFQSPMILQVHDELVFDVQRSELDALKALVVEEMENAYPLAVPLVADTGVGATWLEAH
ncbi:MAG: DNA polymerase I [Bacteroidetes bacterium]|nr:DNA polymerase I [Bacteroidota bacterium]MDA1199191.1 DNA polymerase I [Bacteroidota bacterium]